MRVAVIMGSASDADKMEACINILKDFGVDVTVRALSAHRAHKALEECVNECNENGTDVIITAAGMAAALPGVVASMTVLPVIGVPLKAVAFDGLDALMSIVQMPSGVPVATVAINGGKNAAYLALQIMGIKYPELSKKLKAFRKEQEDSCLKTDQDIRERY